MTNPPILTPEFVIYDPLCSRCRKLAGRDAAGVPPDAALCVGHLRRRAAEDAATIARLREHLALSEQHKLVAIESRRDREAELARLTQERDEARALWDEVGQHIDRAAIGWNHPQIAAVFHENRQKTTLYREALIRAETAEAALATLREAHVEQMRPPRARRPRKVAPDLWAQVPPEILDKMNELLAENSRLKRLYALSRQAMAKCRTCRRRGLRQSPREGTDLQR